VQILFAASTLLLMTVVTPLASASAADPGHVAIAANAPSAEGADEPEFTPLDEIERVREAGCGRDNFDEFLEWYANSSTSGGWLEQVVWTDYMVHVGKLAEPDGPGHWVDRQDYLGQFRITSRDLRFSRDGIVAPRDTPNRQITLTRTGADRYRVDWRGGLGWAGVEGADRDAQAGAYIFEYKKDCWYLTGDLR
jgi:hypothetical protein